MSNKIALISTYCDSEEKLNLLYENILTIKSLDVDVLIFTPFKLEDKFYQVADYIIYDKENPILDWPEKSYFNWWGGTVDGKIDFSFTTTYPDYGYAGLVQVKKMANYALGMDNYQHFFPMIYDINVNDHVKEVFQNPRKNSFFPSKRDDLIWDIGLHLISLDREHLTRFKNMITKESYLREGSFDAFAWLHRAVFLVPGIIEKEPIEDLIYYLDGVNFFNETSEEEFSCFIHKSPTEINMAIVFYGYGGLKTFRIIADNFNEEYEIREWNKIELPFSDTKTLIIQHNNKEIDLSKRVCKIKHNLATVNIK